jgi:hypothetical protein
MGIGVSIRRVLTHSRNSTIVIRVWWSFGNDGLPAVDWSLCLFGRLFEPVLELRELIKERVVLAATLLYGIVGGTEEFGTSSNNLKQAWSLGMIF